MKKNDSIKLKKDVKVKKANPNKYLSKEFIGSAIMECFLNNDPDGVVELLQIYLEEQNKVKFFEETDIPRSTAYQFFRHKNPTIRTVAKCISGTQNYNKTSSL